MANYDKPARSQYFNGPLYDRMAEDLQLTGKAQRTVHGYLRAVRMLADHCRKAPDRISESELRRYFLYLKNNRQAAYGTLRVALSGIRFFYRTTCPRDWNVLSLLKLKNEKTLPEVITRQQVRQIILGATTQRMRVFFWTVYSLGLRLNEALNLQVGDLDGQRKMVHVHRGKGAKDRYIPISQFTLEALRRYWLTHRHPKFLFPADGRNHSLTTLPAGCCSKAKNPMSMTAAQAAIKKITRKLNFGKKVSTHTLRHSFATHLLEAGVSLRVIQQYLGHSSLMTTIEYLHLTDTAKQDARAMIEKLFQWQIDSEIQPQTDSKTEATGPLKSKPQTDSKADSKTEPKTVSRAEPKPEPKNKSKSQHRQESKADPKSQSKSQRKGTLKNQPKAKPQSKAKPQPQPAPHPQPKSKPASQPQPQTDPQSKRKRKPHDRME